MRKHRSIAAVLMATALAAPVWVTAGLPAAHAAEAATAHIPPIPAGLARIWFIRQFQPGESLEMPMIFVNGAPLASSVPGTLFYRDFAPGSYTFSVETCTRDFNQEATLTLPPGSETELEVQSLSSFYSYGCVPGQAFYVRQIPAQWARIYLPQLAYLGAR